LKKSRVLPGIFAAQGLTALVITATLAASFGGQRDAQAFPAYAKKENKPCSFCHVNPQGGGKRNAAGLYYKAHGLSLVGYKPAATPTPAGKATPAAKKPTATPTPKSKTKTTKKA